MVTTFESVCPQLVSLDLNETVQECKVKESVSKFN